MTFVDSILQALAGTPPPHRLCRDCADKYPTSQRCFYALPDDGQCARCGIECSRENAVPYGGKL